MKRAVVLILLVSCGPTLSPEQQAQGARDLVIAAHRGNVTEVARLLDLGVHPDARCGEVPEETFKDRNGGWPVAAAQWNALIAAASSDRAGGHLDVVRLLIRRKADLNLHDGYGATALYAAVYRAAWDKNSVPIALALLDAGAEVNTRTGIYIDGTGDVTPLHRAMGHPVLAKALLDRRANPNAQDGAGNTPLHWAVRDNDVDCVKLLIAAGADLNVRSGSGRTPLSWISSARRMKELREQFEKDPDLTAEARARILKLLEDEQEPPSELEKLLRAAGATD